MKAINPACIRWYIDPETGQRLPSCTSVLQLMPDDPYIEKWKNSLTTEEYTAYMDKVFTRGDIIHKVCEDYFSGTYSPIPLEPEYQCYINGFHRFLALYNNDITPYRTEESMSSAEL